MEGCLLSRFLLLKLMVSLSLWKQICSQYFCYSIGWQTCHYGRQSVVEIFLLHWIIALSLWKAVCCRDFCYSNGWQPCHYGRQSVVDIFVTPMDGSLVIMEGSLLSTFLLLQWMVALSLWKIVCCRVFFYYNGWQPCHYERYSVVEIFVTIMDCSLVVMDGSLLSISLLLQCMVAQSLWKVVCCRDFCYYNGWQPCHYGRQSVVEIFVTPMDGSLVIMEGSLLSRFLLL